MNKAIQRAISICGSQKKLAEHCGVSQMSISYWVKGGGISAKYIPLIVKATDGKVRADEICPELAPLFKS